VQLVDVAGVGELLLGQDAVGDDQRLLEQEHAPLLALEARARPRRGPTTPTAAAARPRRGTTRVRDQQRTLQTLAHLTPRKQTTFK